MSDRIGALRRWWPTTRSGARFTHRQRVGGELVERSVSVAQEDRRWVFHATGQPLPEEDVSSYEARRKRDRLNEEGMSQLLGRLGAFPWSEDFYAVGESQFFLLRRIGAPDTIVRRPSSEVVRAG